MGIFHSNVRPRTDLVVFLLHHPFLSRYLQLFGAAEILSSTTLFSPYVCGRFPPGRQDIWSNDFTGAAPGAPGTP